jgi:SSS family transporter
MAPLDWIIFAGFLLYVVFDGTRRGRQSHTSDDYFLAGRSQPWWAMGLSIMATQASAITMIGTTGQGWADGMRFVQFYYALPLAMLILAYTAVPHFHRLRVSTAYEYLGRRFDQKTRALAAILFLVLRGLSVGFVIFTPSLVLAKVFGLPLTIMVLVMGGVAVAYTAVGGLGAVIATDVKQMMVMTLGLVVALITLILNVEDGVGMAGALTLAREAGRLELADLSWDPSERYTIWSSLIGGLFLFLSYFGTDQSQVQRLLSGRSLSHVRGALLLNGLAKVPFQMLVLFIGVLLFVVSLGSVEPISYDPSMSGEVEALADDARSTHAALSAEHAAVRGELRTLSASVAAGNAEPADLERYRTLLQTAGTLREEARELRGGTRDSHYVFLEFILTAMPVGIVGLLLGAIFAAALSSIDSEINSMTTVAVLDVRPLFRGQPLEGDALVRVSRIVTLVVGAFATAFALYAGQIGSLIEGVNRVGSYVYGSLLGAFVLAVGVRRANGTGAFVGLLSGMVVVGIAAETDLAFLYLNTVGTVTVVVVGTVVSLLRPERASTEPTSR